MPLVPSDRVPFAAVLPVAAHDHATILDQAETAPAQLIAGVATGVDEVLAAPKASLLRPTEALGQADRGSNATRRPESLHACLLSWLQAPQMTHVLTLELELSH